MEHNIHNYLSQAWFSKLTFGLRCGKNGVPKTQLDLSWFGKSIYVLKVIVYSAMVLSIFLFNHGMYPAYDDMLGFKCTYSLKKYLCKMMKWFLFPGYLHSRARDGGALCLGRREDCYHHLQFYSGFMLTHSIQTHSVRLVLIIVFDGSSRPNFIAFEFNSQPDKFCLLLLCFRTKNEIQRFSYKTYIYLFFCKNGGGKCTV